MAPQSGRRWGAVRLAVLLAGAQIVVLCLLLSRLPPLSAFSRARRAEASTTSSVASLRRCLPLSGRDARFALPGECVTAQQRLEALYALLRELSAALEAADVAYWLDSGALLGQFRAESLVIWDAHVAVGVLSPGMAALRAGPSQLALSPALELDVDDSQVRLVDTRYGFFVRVFAMAESVGAWPPETDEGGGERVARLLESEPSVQWSQCVGCRAMAADGEALGGQRARRGTRAVAKQLAVPEDWVLPPRSCSVGGLRVRCPARTELYLAHEFGERNF